MLKRVFTECLRTPSQGFRAVTWRHAGRATPTLPLPGRRSLRSWLYVFLGVVPKATDSMASLTQIIILLFWMLAVQLRSLG